MGIPKQNITIKDIAQRAGVSTTTVSSVLNNGKIIVGPDTKKRILDAVKKTGYRPSRKAKQLRMQKNRIIAFQLDSRISSDEIWRPTVLLTLLQLQGICSYANDKGYNVTIVAPQKGKDLQEIEKQIINENSVDGIILSGWRNLPEMDTDKILSGISRCNIPIITMHPKIYEKGYPSVSVNLRSGIKKAFSRLQTLGHKFIAYVGVTEVSNPQHMTQRFDIISEELANHNLEFQKDCVFDVFSEVDSYRKTFEMLNKNKNCPDCIIYSGDHLAMSGMKAIMDAGLKIPEDISVIGFDNAPYAVNSPVPLATINQKHYDQGVMMAKQLIDQIENPEFQVPGLSVIESDFIERSSLGHAKKR